MTQGRTDHIAVLCAICRACGEGSKSHAYVYTAMTARCAFTGQHEASIWAASQQALGLGHNLSRWRCGMGPPKQGKVVVIVVCTNCAQLVKSGLQFDYHSMDSKQRYS